MAGNKDSRGWRIVIARRDARASNKGFYPSMKNPRLGCICQGKVDSKNQLWKAQFGPVLNWAFVTQCSMKALVIEVLNILIQQRGNIFCASKIEVKI